jgi:hypothetical protein
MTLELLHQEYLERHPHGYRYTHFCDHYRDWVATRGFTMRQVHFAGEKLFVDYSGKKPNFIDPVTGERVEAELFVAAMGVELHVRRSDAHSIRVGLDCQPCKDVCVPRRCPGDVGAGPAEERRHRILPLRAYDPADLRRRWLNTTGPAWFRPGRASRETKRRSRARS